MKLSCQISFKGNELYSNYTDSSYEDVVEFLLPVSEMYPDIQNWFLKKVIPGIYCGTRHIERIYLNNQLVALGIAKKSDEKKICTIRVRPGYENQGFGTQIIDSLIKWLGTDKPLITVAEEKISDFENIFKRYNFSLSYTHNSLYRREKIEYIFNHPKSF
jgi:GNAT superfamily N-acetyltransferase